MHDFFENIAIMQINLVSVKPEDGRIHKSIKFHDSRGGVLVSGHNNFSDVYNGYVLLFLKSSLGDYADKFNILE